MGKRAGCEVSDIGEGRGTGELVFLLVCLVVVGGIVLAAHWPSLSAKALSLDDDQYLVENRLVRNPSWASARRFLTEVFEPSTVRGYYQPLSMISLMLDCAMGGGVDNLKVFHRTSLFLHVANSLLLVVFLYFLFGRVLPAGAGDSDAILRAAKLPEYRREVKLQRGRGKVECIQSAGDSQRQIGEFDRTGVIK